MSAACSSTPSQVCEAAGCPLKYEASCELRRLAEAWTPEQHLDFERSIVRTLDAMLPHVPGTEWLRWFFQEQADIRKRQLLGHKSHVEADQQTHAHVLQLALNHQPTMPPFVGDIIGLAVWVNDFNIEKMLPGRFKLSGLRALTVQTP